MIEWLFSHIEYTINRQVTHLETTLTYYNPVNIISNPIQKLYLMKVAGLEYIENL